MAAAPHHLGEILARRFEAVGVLLTELARQLDAPANRITQMISGKHGITSDSALRPAHWSSDYPQFWMHLQAMYDLELVEAEFGIAIRSLPTGQLFMVIRLINI